MEKNRIEHIISRVSDMLTEPSLDMDICIEGANPPCINLKYTTENGATHTKTIDILPELYQEPDEEIAKFIIFQTEQFMEEIDSIEYSGE